MVGLTRVIEMRIEEFEIPFIRVLHLLSHHPDMANIAVDPATVEKSEEDELDPAEARKQTIGHLAKYDHRLQMRPKKN